VQSSAKMLSDAIGLATVRAGRAFGIPTNATAYWNRRFAKGARHAGLTHSPGISNDYCTVRMRMPVATSRAREEMGEYFALGFRFALIGPVRLDVREHHTRSLCAQSPAQSEQWCCWFGRRRSIFGSAEIAAICALQRLPLDG
jgi:hypothetical protein